jgi:hypothetical protein
MKGNFQVRFLGEVVAVTPLPYPTHRSLVEWNMVNPTSLLLGGRPTARKADGMRGNGTLEKANAVL